MRVRCVRGWEMNGVEDRVIAETREHGRRLHNMDASREQILAMAIPDDSGDAEDRPAPT
jgi:hypothetical protein